MCTVHLHVLYFYCVCVCVHTVYLLVRVLKQKMQEKNYYNIHHVILLTPHHIIVYLQCTIPTHMYSTCTFTCTCNIIPLTCSCLLCTCEVHVHTCTCTSTCMQCICTFLYILTCVDDLWVRQTQVHIYLH